MNCRPSGGRVGHLRGLAPDEHSAASSAGRSPISLGQHYHFARRVQDLPWLRSHSRAQVGMTTSLHQTIYVPCFSMGLGKSIQVITFVEIFLRVTQAKKVLLIVPINVIQNWMAEFEKWLPMYVSIQ